MFLMITLAALALIAVFVAWGAHIDAHVAGLLEEVRVPRNQAPGGNRSAA